MALDHPVSFKYYKWSLDKVLVERHPGKIYYISPLAAAVDDGKYYMIGFSHDENMNKTFRIDKIGDIVMDTIANREGTEEFDKHSGLGEVVKQIRMYAGKEERVHVRAKNDLINVLLDEFGMQIPIHKNADGTFNTILKVQVSDQFYGYIMGLGTDVEIIKPEYVRREFQERMNAILTMYGIKPE